MKTIGKIFKWALRIVGGAALLFVILVGAIAIAWRISGRNLLPWQKPEVIEVEKVVEVQVPAECEECPECPAPAADPDPDPAVAIPDIVNHFYDLGAFYIDGDPFVDGFKTQGAEMNYTCQYNGGVFITMDPGVVNGQSTGDLGAVFFVACNKGDIVTLTTPHWSDSALHQQIHLVEFTQEITAEQALTFLEVLKIDEGKPVAYFIDSEGTVTIY